RDAVDEIVLETEHAMKALGIHRHMTKQGKGNVKARTRMVVQYALANELNLLVIGTDHASEALTGFFTKWGDGAADAMPLSSLNKRQVRQLGTALGIPDRSEEHTSELQSRENLVCRLLLEEKKQQLPDN